MTERIAAWSGERSRPPERGMVGRP